MQDAINRIVEDSDRNIPLFVYYLADYQGERIVSCAPISVGDSISVHLTDDTYLSEKIVLRVHHLDEPQNVGKQILTAFVTLQI